MICNGTVENQAGLSPETVEVRPAYLLFGGRTYLLRVDVLKQIGSTYLIPRSVPRATDLSTYIRKDSLASSSRTHTPFSLVGW